MDASAKAVDLQGRSPLFHAVRGGHSATVSLLLEADADVNLADKHGTTPLLALGKLIAEARANEGRTRKGIGMCF